MKKEYLFGTKGGGLAFTVTTLLYIFIAVIGGLILSAFGLKSTDGAYVFISAFFSAITIAIVILYFSVNTGERVFGSTQVKKFNAVYLIFSVLLAVGVFCGFGFINDATASLIKSLGGNAGAISFLPETATELLLFILCYALVPAVFEELFFRGFLIRYLYGVRTWAAVIVSALCFALYHGNFAQFFYQFIYGAALGLLTVSSGSVIPSVFAHFINNLAVILFTYFSVNINLYDPLLIVFGVAVSVCVSVALIFILRKKQNSGGRTAENGNGLGGFFAFASVGMAFCLLLAIGNVFNV